MHIVPCMLLCVNQCIGTLVACMHHKMRPKNSELRAENLYLTTCSWVENWYRLKNIYLWALVCMCWCCRVLTSSKMLVFKVATIVR